MLTLTEGWLVTFGFLALLGLATGEGLLVGLGALVLITWVFFRSANLSRAVTLLGCMVGLVSVPPGHYLIGGLIYQPYYLLSISMAALVTCLRRSTWGWVQNLSVPKMVACLILLWISLVFLETQSYNPFIYFIF